MRRVDEVSTRPRWLTTNYRLLKTPADASLLGKSHQRRTTRAVYCDPRKANSITINVLITKVFNEVKQSLWEIGFALLTPRAILVFSAAKAPSDYAPNERV